MGPLATPALRTGRCARGRSPRHRLLLATTVSGCMVGPDYSRPSVETPLAFKEGGTREDSAAYVASRKGWRPAAPNDGAERGDWWRVFRDPDPRPADPPRRCRQPEPAGPGGRLRAGARASSPRPAPPCSPRSSAPPASPRSALARHRAHQRLAPGSGELGARPVRPHPPQHRERGRHGPGRAPPNSPWCA